MLTDKQIIVLNLLIYEGKLKREAAEAVGVIPETISNWFHNEEFSKTFVEMRTKLLEEASYKALQVMINLASNADSQAVQLNAAKDLMSRAGMDATTKTEIKSDNFTVEFKGKTPNESNSK